MAKIYLIGFMGVGKSTAGKKLASKLDWQFVDTDAVFEEKYKLRIDAFFEKYGEKLFRKLEHDILKSTFDLNNCVVSTGGGLPCHEDAMRRINENGLSVYLEMDPNAILNRLSYSKQKRPLAMNKSKKELLGFIHDKLKERHPFYSQAKITVPALSIKIDFLLELIRARCRK